MASSGNKKRNSAQQKENYKSYDREMRWKKNRMRNLKRHLKKFPNDLGAAMALEKLGEASVRTPRHVRKSNGNTCRLDKLKVMTLPTTVSIQEQLNIVKSMMRALGYKEQKRTNA